MSIKIFKNFVTEGIEDLKGLERRDSGEKETI
jgi:hypothetical protein